MRIGLILQNPSPHQLALLNALSEQDGSDYFVGYLNEANTTRHWGAPKPDLAWSAVPKSGFETWINDCAADMWVLSSVYTDVRTHRISRAIVNSGGRYIFMGEPPRPRSGVRHWIQTWLLKRALKSAEGIIATGKVSLRRYQEIRPGLSGISVPYYPDNLPESRIRQLSSDTDLRFVTSAQLIHRKGIDVLIDACEQLPDNGWQLKIYGDGEERASLEASAKRTGKAITFHGVKPYPDRYQIFDEADVFVLPTRWDGWGMVVPEALHSGLPVIATNQAMSACELISDGANGFLGPADSSSFLAEAMQKFLSKDFDYAAFSEAAIASVSDYRADLGAADLDVFLRGILQK